MFLQISVSNSDASNTVTPAPVPLWIDRIEFIANNGSDVIQTLYGDQIFLNYGLYTDEQLSYIATVSNMNTSFAGPSAIATSSSITYYCYLPGNFAQQSEGFFLGALTGSIICRIYSRNAVESGTGTLVTDDVKLLMECEQLPQNELEQLLELHKQSPVMYPVLDCSVLAIGQTYTASTQYRLNLTNVTAQVAYAIGGLRSSKSNTSAGYRTFADLGKMATLELKDSAGQNQNGGSTLEYAQIRYIEAPKYWKGKLASSLAVLPLCFCLNPVAAVSFGVKQGGYYFDSKINSTSRLLQDSLQEPTLSTCTSTFGAIETAIADTLPANTYSVTYDSVTMHFRISNAENNGFMVNWSSHEYASCGMWKFLGWNQEDYTIDPNQFLESDYAAMLSSPLSVLLRIPEFGAAASCGNLQYTSDIPLNVNSGSLAYITSSTDYPQHLDFRDARRSFQELQFIIIDHENNIVNFNGVDWELLLEVEYLPHLSMEQMAWRVADTYFKGIKKIGSK